MNKVKELFHEWCKVMCVATIFIVTAGLLVVMIMPMIHYIAKWIKYWDIIK